MESKEREGFIRETFVSPDAAAVTGQSAHNENGGGNRFEQHEPASQRHFAGFWIRVAANIADYLFILGVSYLIFNPLRRAFGYNIDAFVFSPIDIIEFVFNFLYVIVLTWWTGQTLGKMIFGIRVVSARADGARNSRLTLGQVLLREIVGKTVSFIVFGIGFIWVAFQDQKQGWHDKIAKTYVVRVR